MASKDGYLNRLIVDGIGDLGLFDTWKGGKGDSQETKYNAAGTGGQKALGGRPILENVTLGRLYDLQRDHELVRRLHAVRGKARCIAIRQPGDEDGRPFGTPYVYNGVFKAVTPGDTDSNQAGADMFEVEVSVDGDLG